MVNITDINFGQDYETKSAYSERPVPAKTGIAQRYRVTVFCLSEEGYIEQTQGARDKRQRLLSLTAKGEELETRLTDLQCRRFAKAYGEKGVEAVNGFQEILASLINEDDDARQMLQTPIAKGR